MKLLPAILLALLPVSALAQSAAPTAEAAPDPARLAAAQAVIDQLWPLGTYRRMMQGTMSKMMDTMMGGMFKMRGADLAQADPTGKAAEKMGDKTLGELAESQDPHFRERMRITMDVMTKEMIPVMEHIEPGIRAALARSYARQFTVQQLADMRAFFATPSGRAYAERAMLIFVDPEMMQSMTSFVPELMKAMPGIIKKVEAATAHLPPAPKRGASQ